MRTAYMGIMATPTLYFDAAAAPRAGNWTAVYALTLCVSTLVASEFMPVSLLTPLATDLQLTEGQAGLAMSASGLFAVLTSLCIASVTRRIDRRTLLLGLTLLMLASGLVVALAPNFTMMLAGRALVGIVIGGFWSMSAATVMRLVPKKDVPGALAILNGGNALAVTVAAPLGSFLGEYIGWRGAFFAIVPLAAITLAWQFLTLPAMPSRSHSKPAGPLAILRRPQVVYGFIAVTLFFMGQFALFTYLRPFLETVAGISGGALSLSLLILGLAGLLGTWLIRFGLEKRLYGLLVALPLAMAATGLGLVVSGSSPLATTALLALWGLFGTAAPVAWWTWLSKTLPDDAEAGGGLMVAVVQLAITAGAAGGGMLFDWSGYTATFLVSAAIFCGSAAVAFFGSQADRNVVALAQPPVAPALFCRNGAGSGMLDGASGAFVTLESVNEPEHRVGRLRQPFRGGKRRS
jgi:predicted MFS family arabinose efflux permease